MLRGPRDEHERALLVVQGLHVHESAEIVQLLGERRLRLVPDDLSVGAQVLDVRSPLAVPAGLLLWRFQENDYYRNNHLYLPNSS